MIIGKYVMAGLGVACAALALAVGIQTSRLGTAQERLEAARVAIASAQAANLSNLEVIADLQEANHAWASAMKAANDEKDRLRMERDNAQHLAEEAITAERHARQELYDHDQPAAQWAATRVPPAVLQRLREYPAAR